MPAHGDDFCGTFSFFVFADVFDSRMLRFFKEPRELKWDACARMPVLPGPSCSPRRVLLPQKDGYGKPYIDINVKI